MGKIVISDNVSLDGVIQDPAGDEGFERGGWVGLIKDRPGANVVLTLFFLLTDVALTFVVPALTFSTRKVREAGRIGLVMIRDEWPGSAWYALAPPLAVLILVRAPLEFGRLGSIGRFATAVAATLLSLAFKGAVARFFLLRPRLADSCLAGVVFVTERHSQAGLQTASLIARRRTGAVEAPLWGSRHGTPRPTVIRCDGIEASSWTASAGSGSCSGPTTLSSRHRRSVAQRGCRRSSVCSCSIGSIWVRLSRRSPRGSTC